MISRRKLEIQILPFSRPGTWIVPEGFSDRAHYCLLQVEAHDAETDRYFDNLKADPMHRRRKTQPAKFPNALHFFSDSAVLAAAMAVEGFLNLYGVVRLGEAFYTKNYERLRPAQKVAALIGTCCGVLVKQDDEIIQVTDRLFKRRNELVHPKSTDWERTLPSREVVHFSPQQLAHDSVIDMERFARLFRIYDSDVPDLDGG